MCCYVVDSALLRCGEDAESTTFGRRENAVAPSASCTCATSLYALMGIAPATPSWLLLLFLPLDGFYQHHPFIPCDFKAVEDSSSMPVYCDLSSLKVPRQGSLSPCSAFLVLYVAPTKPALRRGRDSLVVAAYRWSKNASQHHIPPR